MVHQKFEKTSSRKEDKWYDRAPPVKARDYLEEMAPINGMMEENNQTRRLREAFRDEVSKRMGELLLRGQTMLDVYCETCAGILMEDRSGTRRCVTCEVYKEKTGEGSQIIAQVPLEPEDYQEAPNSTVTQAPKSTVTSVPRDYSTYADYDDNEKFEKIEEKPKSTKKVLVFGHNKKTSPPGNEQEIAKNAIKQKIKWAAKKLEDEQETRKILEYLEILKISAETLEKFA